MSGKQGPPRISIAVAALLLLSITVLPQSQRQPSVDDEPPIRLETTLVQVPVTVKNERGAYAADLRRNDFAIFEDGVQQEIEFFGTVAEPFSVALLVDSSGSTEAQIEQIKESVLAFLDTLRDRDRAMIVEFNDSVRVLSGLTNDKWLLRAAVAGIQPGEFTQVYEAVYTAVWERLHEVEGRKAVVIFTDGIDTASSEIKREVTLDAVLESEDVLVYPIRYGTRRDVEKKLAVRYGGVNNEQSPRDLIPPEVIAELDRTYRSADEYLQELADSSGGIVEFADSLSDLKAAFHRIAHELRQQYLLGYYPTNPQKARRRTTRRIRVEVKRPGMSVRARPAYTSPR